MPTRWGPAPEGLAGSQIDWQTACELLEAGQYEQVAEILLEAELVWEQSDETALVQLLATACRVCLACSQSRSEVEWHRRARQEADQRERELQQQLYTILKLIGEIETSDKPVQEERPRKVRTVETPLLDRSTSDAYEQPTFLQRVQALFGWGGALPSHESKALDVSGETVTPNTIGFAEAPFAPHAAGNELYPLPDLEVTEALTPPSAAAIEHPDGSAVEKTKESIPTPAKEAGGLVLPSTDSILAPTISTPEGTTSPAPITDLADVERVPSPVAADETPTNATAEKVEGPFPVVAAEEVERVPSPVVADETQTAVTAEEAEAQTAASAAEDVGSDPHLAEAMEILSASTDAEVPTPSQAEQVVGLAGPQPTQPEAQATAVDADTITSPMVEEPTLSTASIDTEAAASPQAEEVAKSAAPDRVQAAAVAAMTDTHPVRTEAPTAPSDTKAVIARQAEDVDWLAAPHPVQAAAPTFTPYAELLGEAQAEEGVGHAIPPPMQAEAPTASLVVHCLGPFRVFQDDQLITEWPSSKGKAIFKYLVAHHERPVPKEVLMERFWPGAHPDAARNNLNVAIYGLRQALRKARPSFSHVLFQNDCYLLNPELEIWLDREAFDRSLVTARVLEQRGDLATAVREYQAAEALYQGEFLEEDRYEDWLIPERQRLCDDYLNLLDRLGRHYFNQDDFAACTTMCRKMLAMDPCREEAHRRLMRCYNRQGQPYLALRQYHYCVEVLKAELDVAPVSATTQLYKRIRRREPL